MYYSQVINGAILPVILIFMLLLVNDRKIMGEYTNGLVMNIVSWLTVAILTVLVPDHAGLRVVHQVVTARRSNARSLYNE